MALHKITTFGAEYRNYRSKRRKASKTFGAYYSISGILRQIIWALVLILVV
ncbi:hypothetical protein PTT_17924 [Pyrenophora teres f. teres 0-1]|uniref:Uncharacterized protein n=1 Tax=Pyrenophora teres f. teres (strain 0-1) TaxID=861557 RepID=E3S5K7_PYRTT|nr:hypothetical protein PTT_17924 [Pyrenophora teres f. teres 0-1]